MPKLENFTNFIKINGIPHGKNNLNYQIKDDYVSLYYEGTKDSFILDNATGKFNTWTNGNLKTYDSLLELTTDLDNYLYDGVNLQGVINETRNTNELLKNMCVYLEIISNQLQSLEEDGGNFGIGELKSSILK